MRQALHLAIVCSSALSALGLQGLGDGHDCGENGARSAITPTSERVLKLHDG
jgi:hypothetical protein